MSSLSAALHNFKFTTRAFQSRNYRLFLGGQIVSLTGSWLSMIAMSWLVYRISKEQYSEHAPFLLGLANFCNQIPIFLITPLAGVLVDRHDRQKILLWTQTLAMAHSFTLAWLTLTHRIHIGQILVLSAVQGLINSVDMPARQSFLIEIVEKRGDLSNAIALNASMVHLARLLGPALGGILIYAIGEGRCFLLDGISYFAVLAALIAIRIPPSTAAVPTDPIWRSFREGLQYAFRSVPIRTLLLLIATSSLLFMSQMVLMPIVADKILRGNERTLGFLLGSSGMGAFIGSLYLASRKSIVGLGKILVGASASLGLGLLLFSLSRNVWLSGCLLLITGGSMVLLMASSNTILQTIVDDNKRGRVMSLFTLAFMGTAPFGSLLAGTFAAQIGVPLTLALCGLIFLSNAILFSKKLPRLRSLIRPIYTSKGILPAE